MRGQFRRWVFRIFAVILGLLLCAIIAGSIYQAIESMRERRLYPPPGELIDVGGYHLHLTCAGTGSPTVVLEWSYSLTWYLVQPEIARFTRVCAVDPAGIGWSDSGPSPRDSDQIAKELNLLLSRANVPPPYILVGHSRGAFHIRVYAARFHNGVAGVVFVDPEDENTSKRIPELNPSAVVRAGLRIGPLLTRIGMVRLAGLCGARTWLEGPGVVVPPKIDKMSVAVECRPSVARAVAEYQWALLDSAEEARKSGVLGDIPLVVISRDPTYYPAHDDVSAKLLDTHIEEVWTELQKNQLRLSSNSRQVIASGSGHGIPWERPDAVISAVQSIVQSWRLSNPQIN